MLECLSSSGNCRPFAVYTKLANMTVKSSVAGHAAAFDCVWVYVRWAQQWAQLVADLVKDKVTSDHLLVDVLNEPDNYGIRWEAAARKPGEPLTPLNPPYSFPLPLDPHPCCPYPCAPFCSLVCNLTVHPLPASCLSLASSSLTPRKAPFGPTCQPPSAV